VLTAYAESDFRNDVRSANPTSSGYYSEGVFQQTLPWWKHDHWDIPVSTAAFVGAFRRATGDPVTDCWRVQRWNAPDPAQDQAGFLASQETKNYLRRIPLVSQIIQTGRLP
jgi:hypothetical protein